MCATALAEGPNVHQRAVALGHTKLDTHMELPAG
jgi:hypothetical protein